MYIQYLQLKSERFCKVRYFALSGYRYIFFVGNKFNIGFSEILAYGFRKTKKNMYMISKHLENTTKVAPMSTTPTSTACAVVTLSMNNRRGNTLCTLHNKCSLACGSSWIKRSWSNWYPFFVKAALATPLFCFIPTYLNNWATVVLKQFPEVLTHGHPLSPQLLRSGAINRGLRIARRCAFFSTRACERVWICIKETISIFVVSWF